MEWVINLFIACETNLEPEAELNFLDIQNDVIYRNRFAEKELSEFWTGLQDQYPILTL